VQPTHTLDLALRYRHATGALGPYFAGLFDGIALGTRCDRCGKTWFPPRLTCTAGHVVTRWEQLAGTGVVHSVTRGPGRLPFRQETGEHAFALIMLDGACNLAFGRLVGNAAGRATGDMLAKSGDTVRLVRPDMPAPHPAQYACFARVEAR